MKFNFFHDPGHGWLEVSIDQIIELNLLERISGYSYVKRVGENVTMAYLEEDCDAPLFIEAWKAKGRRFIYNEIYQDRESPIREYRGFPTAFKSLV